MVGKRELKRQRSRPQKMWEVNIKQILDEETGMARNVSK
jgi:hypothetical protein